MENKGSRDGAEVNVLGEFHKDWTEAGVYAS